MKPKKEKKEEPLPKVGKKTLKKENKILTGVFITAIVVFLLIISIFFTSKSVRFSTYKEVVDFETVKEGELIFHKTLVSIPGEYGTTKNYNFYLRTKPKDLEAVPFESSDEFKLMKISVINSEEGFNCDGKGTIAIANLKNIHDVMGASFFSDENATCDSQGRYNYFYLKKANQTSVEKIGENCYNLNINNCEILPVTEKIMAEIFLKLK